MVVCSENGGREDGESKGCWIVMESRVWSNHEDSPACTLARPQFWRLLLKNRGEETSDLALGRWFGSLMDREGAFPIS